MSFLDVRPCWFVSLKHIQYRYPSYFCSFICYSYGVRYCDVDCAAADALRHFLHVCSVYSTHGWRRCHVCNSVHPRSLRNCSSCHDLRVLFVHRVVHCRTSRSSHLYSSRDPSTSLLQVVFYSNACHLREIHQLRQSKLGRPGVRCVALLRHCELYFHVHVDDVHRRLLIRKAHVRPLPYGLEASRPRRHSIRTPSAKCHAVREGIRNSSIDRCQVPSLFARISIFFALWFVA